MTTPEEQICAEFKIWYGGAVDRDRPCRISEQLGDARYEAWQACQRLNDKRIAELEQENDRLREMQSWLNEQSTGYTDTGLL